MERGMLAVKASLCFAACSLVYVMGFLPNPFTKANEIANLTYTATLHRVNAEIGTAFDYDNYAGGVYEPKWYAGQRKSLNNIKDLLRLTVVPSEVNGLVGWVKTISTNGGGNGGRLNGYA